MRESLAFNTALKCLVSRSSYSLNLFSHLSSIACMVSEFIYTDYCDGVVSVVVVIGVLGVSVITDS